MGIVDEDVARVRESTDVVAVVSEYTQLKRVGLRWQGLCPFHAEKSPSFSVNVEDGLYYCFGCGVGGDMITFVQEKEQLDFVGAVEWLAGKAGLSLRYTTSGQGEERRRKAVLQDAIAEAVEWYHDRLLTSPEAGPARGYLRQRGYDGEVVRDYRLGWAPDGVGSAGSGPPPVRPGPDRQRIGVRQPARTPAGCVPGPDPVSDLRPSGQACRLRGPQSSGFGRAEVQEHLGVGVYAKSKVLYGLHRAKTAVVEADEVIVCEGYTDVIGYAQAGLGRAVATCGTALTEEHVKLLRRFARRVVLSFDADAAGQNAAARFYEWESTHDLDVAVAALPVGGDPADLALSDPDRLRAAVGGGPAVPGVPGRPGHRGRRPIDQRGPGPGRRAGPGHGC